LIRGPTATLNTIKQHLNSGPDFQILPAELCRAAKIKTSAGVAAVVFTAEAGLSGFGDQRGLRAIPHVV